MRRKKNQRTNGFNVWSSYSDMMAGVSAFCADHVCDSSGAEKAINESLPGKR